MSKILIISPGFFPLTDSRGGAIEELLNILIKNNELSDNDHFVIYSCQIDGYVDSDTSLNNTEFRIIDKRGLMFKLSDYIIRFLHKFFNIDLTSNYIRKVINDLNRRKENSTYDLVVFENGTKHIAYFRKKFKTKTKVVSHLHNNYLNSETKDATYIKKCFDEHWVVSEFIKKEVANIDGDDSKIYTLFNCIDERNYYKPSDNEIKQKRRKLNIENNYVFIYTGRVFEGKGVYELIAAFNKLSKKYKNISLLIVGGDVNLSNKSDYYSYVKEIASENVMFVGQVNRKQISEWYSIADAQIIPSKVEEAFGLVVLEGMYFNLPIIASDVGAIKEVGEDKIVYVDKNNLIDNLYYEMERFLNHKQINSDGLYNASLQKYSSKHFMNCFYKLCHKK